MLKHQHALAAALLLFSSVVAAQQTPLAETAPQAPETPSTPASDRAHGQTPAPAPEATNPSTGTPSVDTNEPDLKAPNATQGAAVPGAAPGAGVSQDEALPSSGFVAGMPATTSHDLKPPGADQARPPPASPTLRYGAPEPMTATQDVVEDERYTGPLGYHQRHFFGWLGVRNDYVRDARYDIFADNDALLMSSLGVGGVVLAAGDFSLAALGSWEIGGRTADVRGDRAELLLQRFELGAEARYHLHYRVYGFGRIAMGPARARASLRSELASSVWRAKSWLFSSAVTAGGAVRLLGSPLGDRRVARLWFVAEGGYALTSSASLRFEPSDDSGPERSQTEDLGRLSFNAPLFRLSLAGTY